MRYVEIGVDAIIDTYIQQQLKRWAYFEIGVDAIITHENYVPTALCGKRIVV